MKEIRERRAERLCAFQRCHGTRIKKLAPAQVDEDAAVHPGCQQPPPAAPCPHRARGTLTAKGIWQWHPGQRPSVPQPWLGMSCLQQTFKTPMRPCHCAPKAFPSLPPPWATGVRPWPFPKPARGQRLHPVPSTMGTASAGTRFPPEHHERSFQHRISQGRRICIRLGMGTLEKAAQAVALLHTSRRQTRDPSESSQQLLQMPAAAPPLASGPWGCSCTIGTRCCLTPSPSRPHAHSLNSQRRFKNSVWLSSSCQLRLDV